MTTKLLYICKSPPDKLTAFLMDQVGEGKTVTRHDLYNDPDYTKLVEEIFTHDEVISWW